MGDNERSLKHWTILTQLEPLHIGYWERLGDSLRNAGRFAEARDAFQHAAKLGSTSGSESAEQISLALALSEKMIDAKQFEQLLNDTVPQDPLQAAEVCYFQRQAYYTAYRLFLEAFMVNPSLIKSGKTSNHRDYAVTAALQAAAGLGENPAPVAERPALRKQALNWLQEEFHAHRLLPPSSAMLVREWLRGCLLHPKFSSVRGDAIPFLPLDEQTGWNEFWKEIEATLTTPGW